MVNKNVLLKELTGKDETKAQKAADYLIGSIDKELFKMLVDKSEYLFSFVLENVKKRIEKSITDVNFINVISFFEIYSSYYDDLFALILAKHANEDLTDKMFELLENGTIEQKTYAAKYFVYIPDTIAIETLNKYAFDEDENLCANAAEALGQMQDDISFDIALENLETGDDFDKLKAVKFFCAYGKNYPFKEIFAALKTSKMPENIAGQIPYMTSLLNLLDSESKFDALFTIYYIILGLGEILPLSDIFNFELYDILEELIAVNNLNNKYSSWIALILLNSLSKFRTFTENEEYVFDEDKDTKNEIISILNLLQNQSNDFWEKQKSFIPELLKGSDNEILAALNVLTEFNIKSSIPLLKNLINSHNEIVVCETIKTLKSLNALEDSSKKEALCKIQNENIKVIIEHI